MPPSKPPEIAKKNVADQVQPVLILRTLTARRRHRPLGAWMSDPKNLRLLNAAPKAMTRDDVATYIGQFDQRTHLLLGIFEKQSGLLIGFFRIDIDPGLNRCLGFMMIGERKFRHWSVDRGIMGAVPEFHLRDARPQQMLGPCWRAIGR